MKWMLALVPVAVIVKYILPDNPGWVFLAAVGAIIPLAAVLGEATEHLAFHTGDSIGGLLNATFGNLAELLIFIAVLRSGMTDVVLAGLYGAILVNAILATGLSMLFGGMKHHTQKFQSDKSNEFSTLLAIAVFALAVISIIENNPNSAGPTEDTVNVLLAVALVIGYLLFLVYSLITHKDLHAPSHHSAEDVWSVKKALLWLVGATVGVVWISEILSGAVESAMHNFSLNERFVGAIILAVVGGAAEMAAAVRAARANRLDLSLSITMGASVQIALFVAPMLVLVSNLFMPTHLHLNFNGAAVLLLFIAVYIVSSISRGSKSTWYGGAMLVLLYAVLAIGFYLLP